MAEKASGSRFSILVGSSQKDVGQITSLGWDGYSVNMIDVTHMGSASRHKEYLPGVIDAGEISLEVFADLKAADASNQVALLTSLKTAEEPLAMECDFGNSVKLSFNGNVQSFSLDAPYEGTLGASFTVRISGVVTITDVV